MENYIKQVIQEYIEVNELDKSFHSEDMLDKRLMTQNNFDVELSYQDESGRWSRKIVGQYDITDDDREKIKDRLSIITDYDFPRVEKYGVIIHEFNINVPSIRFSSPEQKFSTMKIYVESDEAQLYLVDKVKGSVGDCVISIVNDNKIITTYLAKRNRISAEKFRVDKIIDALALPNYGTKTKK
jgi:hypothetical protein